MDLAKTDLAALPESEKNILTFAGARLLFATAAPHSFETVTAVFSCAGADFTARGKTVLAGGWKDLERRYRATLKDKPEAAPSSGGIHIVQILNILENFDMKKYGFGSADAMQIMAEAEKYAYADRSEYLGDPDFVKVPWQALTNKAYAKSIAEQIDINKAKPSSEIRPGKLAPYESNQTTHYSVVDKDGNAVAVTYTLNTTFGTGIVAGESGILLNNQMDDFSAKPGVPNVYGLVGGDANAVGPNKRPLSSMSPTIVVKDGKTWLVTGSPGGSRIITTVLQMVVNSIDYGMNVAEATNAPRFHHQWLPDELRVEKGFSPDTLKLLEAKGQKVALKEAMGSTQSIMVGPDGELYGASDPRSVDDLTAGY